jgi:hypothetical protein
MTVKLQARNADLGDIAQLLKQQQDAKVDLVTPLANVTSKGGIITVAGTSLFGEDSKLNPTEIADGHIAGKLNIPPSYLKTLRAERSDIYDANVNGWTQGNEELQVPKDKRTVLLRTFVSDDIEETGVLRAVLSDRYARIDNLDVLTAALSGVRDTGANVEVVGCDLTETRMTIRIAAPDILVHAPKLLKGYRSPFGDGEGVYDHRAGNLLEVPQWAQDKFGVNADGVFAGFVITNSETGGGAFTITPRFMVLRCTNGLMITKDVLRQVHLGSKLDHGQIIWSDDTNQKTLALVTAQTRDAVKTFLDEEYVAKVIEGLSEIAETEVTDPQKTIEFIGKKLLFSEEATAGILTHFIKGGQVTAGGVLQAVTSFAQTVENPDLAFQYESKALEALELAAAL